MIADDNELKVTLERVARFQEQVAHLRRVETTLKTITVRFRGFSQRSTACSSKCANI
jgi:hypothetical protein